MRLRSSSFLAMFALVAIGSAASCDGGDARSGFRLVPGTSSMQDPSSGLDLGFALLSRSELPSHEALVAAAAIRGVQLTPRPDPESDATSRQFALDDGSELLVSLMGFPHPDAVALSRGLASPDAESAGACPDHLVVTVLQAKGDVRLRDARMYRVLAAVADSAPVVAAMMAHGWSFVSADTLRTIAAPEHPRDLPVQACLDVSVARDAEGTLSAMTHNMPRYGREDLFVWSHVDDAADTFAFLYSTGAWMLQRPADAFPSGETIGRTAEEKFRIEREPSPADASQTVIVLRMR